MKWFSGDVSQAIAESRREKVVFIVHIEGDNEDSNKMKEIWGHKQVTDLCCKKNCVAIKIDCQSEQFGQFAAFYPVVCIPSTYFIGDNGVPLEIVGGALNVEEFTAKVHAAFQVYRNSINAASSQPTTQESQAKTEETPSTSSSQGSSKEPEIPSQQNKDDEPPLLADQSDTDDDTRKESTSGTMPSNQNSKNVQERVQRAQDVIQKRREEKEQAEREKLKSQESNRRKMGQDMTRAKQQREEQSMREHAAKMREEKLKEKAAREAVKQAIARDRAEQESRRLREKTGQDNERIARETVGGNVGNEPSTSAGVTQNSNTQCSNARIQFRLPDGSCLVNTFDADDLLEAARQFIVERTGSNVVMCTTYPRRQLTEEDYIKTLHELGLTPSSTIVIAPSSQVSSSKRGGAGGFGIVEVFMSYMFAPFTIIWNAMRTFLFGTPPEPRGIYSASTSTQPSTSTEPSSEQSSNLRRRAVNETRSNKEGNIHRLKKDEDDENNTWNGNSTQQM